MHTGDDLIVVLYPNLFFAGLSFRARSAAGPKEDHRVLAQVGRRGLCRQNQECEQV